MAVARRARLALLTALALIAAPSPAGAFTVGAIDLTGAVGCGAGPAAAVQQSVSSGPSYTVPARGVITSWATLNGAASTTGALIAARVSGGTATIVGSTQLTLTPTVNHVTLVGGIHIPVAANDVLGIELLPTTTSDWPCQRSGLAAADQAVGGIPTGVTAGSTFATSSTSLASRLNVQATVEPDADGDGYGDVTEDSCPAILAIHAGPCAIDLALRKVVVDGTVAIGDIAAFTLTVHDATAGLAPGAIVTDALPGGLKPLLALSSAGSCAVAATVTCSLGTFSSAKDVSIVILATARRAGVWKNTASVAGTAAPDPNAANNTARATVTVGECIAPNLKGLKLAAAKKALEKANCKLGKKRGKGKRVARQSVKAGTHKKLGSKVSVTLGA